VLRVCGVGAVVWEEGPRVCGVGAAVWVGGPRVGGVGAAVWVGGPRLGGVGAGGVARMWEWVQQCGCGWKLFLFFPWLFKGGGCITASLCNVKRSNGVECVTDDI